MSEFEAGEYIIYRNGDRFEFVYYSSGDTAAKTPYDCMHELTNGYVIEKTSLGGGE